MPPMKIQPIGSEQEYQEFSKPPPVLKSRLKRLFDRQFNNVFWISSADKPPTISGEVKDVAVVPEFEPSSVCLDKLVQNFIEENPFEKPQTTQKCGRNRCNCFNGNSNDSSDDEFDFGFGDFVSNANSSFGDSMDTLKSLIPCSTTVERNLLADTSKIVEKNKTCKRKDDLREIVTDGLLALGFNASICKSKWDKTSSIPAGEYEYIDVIMEGERVLIDIDFRSEFEIARSTLNYKNILQSLPFIFVGNIDRLQQIIAIVSEAARHSLKKKGMHIAPWRKAEYMKAKWLSPHVRTTVPPPLQNDAVSAETQTEEKAEYMKAKWLSPHARTTVPPPLQNDAVSAEEAEPQTEEKAGEDETEIEKAAKETEAEAQVAEDIECGEFDLIFGEEITPSDEPKSSFLSSPVKGSGEEAKGMTPVIVAWQPPVIKPKSCERSNRVMVTGLASLLKEKP